MKKRKFISHDMFSKSLGGTRIYIGLRYAGTKKKGKEREEKECSPTDIAGIGIG